MTGQPCCKSLCLDIIIVIIIILLGDKGMCASTTWTESVHDSGMAGSSMHDLSVLGPMPQRLHHHVKDQSINQSISMNLLRRPTSKALGRQKYNENTTASQCHSNDSAKRWVLSLVKKSVYMDEVRMCEGRRFQADGAATEKELFESWRLDRGTIKSPHDVDTLYTARYKRDSWILPTFTG